MVVPAHCAQKDAGFALWFHAPRAIVADDDGAFCTITNPFPQVISNPLEFWDFSGGGSPEGAHVSVRVRQDPLGMPPVSMYVTLKVSHADGSVYYLQPLDSQAVPAEWTELLYPLPKAVADWTESRIELLGTTSLISSAMLHVDALWIH